MYGINMVCMREDNGKLKKPSIVAKIEEAIPE